MPPKFGPLQDDEVLSVSSANQNIPLLKHPIMKFGDLREALIRVIETSVIGPNLNANTVKWLREGADVEVLKYGSSGWKKGKMKIKISLEFCPDEPEDVEIPASHQGESSEPESPLDDIRRMQG